MTRKKLQSAYKQNHTSKTIPNKNKNVENNQMNHNIILSLNKTRKGLSNSYTRTSGATNFEAMDSIFSE